jgi:hypothetical protein
MDAATSEIAICIGQEWRLANFDESSMALYRCNDGSFVIARKGCKKVLSVSPACRESMSLCGTVLGDGTRLDPVLVHKGIKRSADLQEEVRVLQSIDIMDTNRGLRSQNSTRHTLQELSCWPLNQHLKHQIRLPPHLHLSWSDGEGTRQTILMTGSC